MSRMRTKPLGTLLGALALVATCVPAAAAVTAGDGFERSMGELLTSFPGGEPLAVTALAIAIGTLILRVTKLFGLLLTVMIAGAVGVAVLMAIEPQVLARLVEAVTQS